MLKVLLFDIETSPNLGYVWEKYEQDVISFEKERELICFAYKWLGNKTVVAHSKGELTRYRLVKRLHELFEEADVIVAHNGDGFDIKMSNTAFIEAGLKPPSPYKTIDTLKIARSKFKFNSNKLNDLANHLGIGEKVETGGFKLWLKCLKGDRKAWKKMKEYNKQDVVLLEKVYFKMRAWTRTPEIENGLKCPTCGGNVQQRGWNINRVFKSKRYQCRQCGKWGTSNLKVKHNTLEYVRS